MGARRAVVLDLEFQQPIGRLPLSPQQAHNQAARNDKSTVSFWRRTWLRNAQKNRETVGSFKEHGAHVLYNSLLYKPCIVIGSGPSLRNNAKQLVAHVDANGKAWEGNPGITVISCLHNFAFLEDLGVHVDYYMTLDAGDVVIDEMFEGGTNTREFYRERSKEKKLLAYMGTNPLLFQNWQGQVLWYNSITGDDDFDRDMDAIEPYSCLVSPGGNVLGGAFYFAKAIMGANPIAFLGADFSFGYEKNFHPWASPYDVQGQTMTATDVYGHKVATWPSYYGFKLWFDSKFATVPGMYVNCSEGGVMGSYPEGNFVGVQQMNLDLFLEGYRVSSRKKPMLDDLEKRHMPPVLF